MHGTLLHHGYTTGRFLWVAVTVALGLTLGHQATAARECARETPLPAEVHLIVPGAEVPEALARFAGVWSGASDSRRSADSLCHTLVVEEVLANGYARLLYSYSSSAYWHMPTTLNSRLPGFLRTTGRIVDGELRAHVPLPGRRLEVTYRLAGDTLEGTLDRAALAVRVRMTRVAELRQVGCAPSPTSPTLGVRDRLTATELQTAEAVGTRLLHNAYFMPMGQTAPALHSFQGRVTVQASSMARGRYGCPGPAETLPGFTVAFFTHGEHLVPVERDILDPPGIIFSPGRVWSESGDGGLSRASFPFVLTSEYTNETHNGLATFLYDDTRVSALRFQVVQENAAWAQYDGWGQAPMTYTPGPLAHAEVVRAQFTAELQQQTPIQPWSALPHAAGLSWLERFDGDAAPTDISANGLIMDGVLYLRGCETRAGPYPYCRHLRHGVHSVTKSLGAAIALLRLAQTYGDQVLALQIRDYVTVTATHNGWEQVTFGDALNMATGIGNQAPQRQPNRPFADENTPQIVQWHTAQTARAKLGISFAAGQYPWGPGAVLRYNRTHTFVLAAAMDSFLKRQVGAHTQLWDMVVAEVFRQLGIVHAPMMHTQEAEGRRGIPLLSIGLYPTIDDVAKLTTLLQHGGQHQGQQLLSATPLAEVFSPTTARGLPSGHTNRFGEGRYHLSFWSVPYRTATGCFFQIPYMLGAGGNLVVLLPNGLSAFRFADGHDYNVDTMVLAGEALRPFPCPAGSPEHPLPVRTPLTASALRAEMPGHTFYGSPVTIFPAYSGGRRTIFVSADGRLYGTFTGEAATRPEDDIGRWRITPEGQWCRTWHVWEHRRERCYTVYREDERFELATHDCFDTEVYTRMPGNPEGY
jgi:hypothetical protein